MDYTLQKALNVIESHNLRDEYDGGLRRYHLRDASDADVRKLADVWQERDKLLPELQQLDHAQRRLLERYAEVAPGLLVSRQMHAENEAQRKAEQKAAEQQQEAAAQAAKQRFFEDVRASYTGPSEDFDAVANRMWREHLYKESQQAMQRTQQLARQAIVGLEF